jgi:UDP-N-acetylglucosamine 3-dehydrogenase
MLEFENGAIGILETTWLRPDGPTLSTAAQLEVIGTSGLVEALPFISCANVYSSNTAAQTNQAYLLAAGPHGFIGGIYRDEVVHFLDCVTTGRAPLCTGREALAAVAVAEAIDRSVATRQEVPVQLPTG